MRGTTIGGKAAAGANDIMGASASGVKYFLHPAKQIGQNGKSIRTLFPFSALRNRTNLQKQHGCGILAGLGTARESVESQGETLNAEDTEKKMRNHFQMESALMFFSVVSVLKLFSF